MPAPTLLPSTTKPFLAEIDAAAAPWYASEDRAVTATRVAETTAGGSRDFAVRPIVSKEMPAAMRRSPEQAWRAGIASQATETARAAAESQVSMATLEAVSASSARASHPDHAAMTERLGSVREAMQGTGMRDACGRANAAQVFAAGAALVVHGANDEERRAGASVIHGDAPRSIAGCEAVGAAARRVMQAQAKRLGV